MAENALGVARRDRELSKIIKLFQTPASPDRPHGCLDALIDGAARLQAATNDTNVATLERGQIAALYSSVRAMYPLLITLCIEDSQLMSLTQLHAGMRGIGGLVERWAKPAELRFAETDYDRETNTLAEYFTATLRGVLVLEGIYNVRASFSATDAHFLRGLDALTLHIITSPQNLLNKQG